MEVLPELYSIFHGEVAAVTEYGAFVKIPGCRKQGGCPPTLVDGGDPNCLSAIQSVTFPGHTEQHLRTLHGVNKIDLKVDFVTGNAAQAQQQHQWAQEARSED